MRSRERLAAREGGEFDRGDGWLREPPETAPGWVDTTARVIAVKAWAGDLLMAWKGCVPLSRFDDPHSETEMTLVERESAAV